jgi:hypothetical protein
MEADNAKRGLAPNLALIALAVASTVAALFAAVMVGGPIIRALLGPPPGFHEDFVSREAYDEALLVQAPSVGIAFLVLGIVWGRGRRLSWKLALAAANPVTVGLGFVIFMVWYKSLHFEWQYEYYGVWNGVRLALAAPIIFAACLRAGATMRKSSFEKLGVAQSK